MIIIIKKSKLIVIAFISLILFTALFSSIPKIASVIANEDEIKETINHIFITKSKAMLVHDIESMDSIYDKSNKLGLWAFEHEEKKMKYLSNWSEKQGVKFIDIIPTVLVRRIRGGDGKYSVNLLCSTEYKYIYETSPQEENSFRIGTYHIISLKEEEGNFLITKEWYTDPFADSLNLENLKVDSIKEYILSQTQRDFSGLSKRRLDAVSYAYKYSGAANEEKYGFTYNKQYGDFNPQGGDCANFASQILFEGGKFKKNSTWNFSNRTGSRAWLNAQGFKDYMVGSGRASVIAHGSYEKVYKASYKLRPGDFVAYEKKGKVTHISVVTDADSKGYALVNCHNTDRNRVPWDLGWSNKNIKFWLVSVHY
jgi:hypothetical protein